MARRGVKRMVSGAVLFVVVSPLIFVLALVFGLLSALGPIGDLERLPPGGKASLEAGQDMVIFIDAAQSSAPTTCAVTGPGGKAVPLTASTGTTVSVNEAEWRKAFVFTAATSGEHVVTCTGVDTLLVERDLADRVARGTLVTVAVAFILPFLTGVAGAVLFVWGLVTFRRSRRAAPPPVFPQPASPAPTTPGSDLPEPPEPGSRPSGAPPPQAPPTSSYEPPRG